MDPVSHGMLGASWAQSRSPQSNLAAAAVVGALSGLAPDLDLLIRSSSDPLLLLEVHRQFTHSLLFAPVGAIVCALLLYPRVGRYFGAYTTYLLCLIGFTSHALLDACTSYGTELFWPVSDMRVALSIIALFDPALTVPLVVLVVIAVRRKRRRYAHVAMLWGIVYLALGGAQHMRAAVVAADIAQDRGHRPARLEVKPALGSLLLWKTIYEYEGRYYVDGVRAGIRSTVYPGESIAKLDVREHLPWLEPNTQQAEDVERFSRISSGLVAVDNTEPSRIVDLRYSMVPNEISGFWAIVLDPSAGPLEHVEFITTQEETPRQALRLLDMLFMGR